jgi:hypothetical protein
MQAEASEAIVGDRRGQHRRPPSRVGAHATEFLAPHDPAAGDDHTMPDHDAEATLRSASTGSH